MPAHVYAVCRCACGEGGAGGARGGERDPSRSGTIVAGSAHLMNCAVCIEGSSSRRVAKRIESVSEPLQTSERESQACPSVGWTRSWKCHTKCIRGCGQRNQTFSKKHHRINKIYSKCTGGYTSDAFETLCYRGRTFLLRALSQSATWLQRRVWKRARGS
jgi:hypothetical protein